MKYLLSMKKYYAVCIKNEGYEASLERRKIYQVVTDKQGAERGLIRIVDESGQSYLYPQSFFSPIKLPQPLLKAFARAA